MKVKLVLAAFVLLSAVGLMAVGCSATSVPPSPPARAIDAIVSTQWLEDNTDKPDLILLDVREPDFYTAGHIPGSINVPPLGSFFLCLMDPSCGLWMEVPPVDDLFATIGNAGITANSTVVVIPRTVASPALGPAELGITMAARVAVTLNYAGVRNVAMLDGGYAKWEAEGRAISTEPVSPPAVEFDGVIDQTVFVSKDYVEGMIGRSTLVDTRDADIYFGIGYDPSSQRPGHIPTSKVLPAPWFWTTVTDESGEPTYMMWKQADEIGEISLAVLGDDADEEFIIYCGVGGYASPVYYVLTEQVGYNNVKFYDGSMQEWTADPEAPVTKYKYE